jgi:hypothetical protein
MVAFLVYVPEKNYRAAFVDLSGAIGCVEMFQDYGYDAIGPEEKLITKPDLIAWLCGEHDEDSGPTIWHRW